jgi:hypothetical protein
MTGAVFNNSGSMVYNDGTINGTVAGGDMTIHHGQPRGQGRHTATGGKRPLVFINYRGSDEAWAATVVWQVWAERIGEHRVFLDNSSIRLGRPFDEELLDAVKGSAVLLAVIGKQWYGVQPDGRRLINYENDWVRREIHHALVHEIPVVPIFIEGINRKLWAQDLPKDLAKLARVQYSTIRQRYWRSDLNGIVARVCELDERLAAEAGEQ